MGQNCRLCLNSGDNWKLLSIFDSDLGDLPQKIEECVSIRICQDDKVTTSICIPCVNQLTQWELFKACCYKSHGILLKEISDIEEDCWLPETLVVQLEDEDDEQKSNENETKAIILQPIDLVENYDVKLEKVAVQDEDEEDEQNSDSNDDETSTLDGILIIDILQDEDSQSDDVPKNIYTCDICSLEFPDSIEDYFDHQETHNGSPVFKCSRCTDVLSSRKELVQHDYKHKIICKQCGKLISRSSMKRHLNRHTDKYKCLKCLGRFNSRADLTQHNIIVHTDIKDHICEMCGKRFSSRGAIRVHMKSHSDKRMYPCKQCPYAGRTASAIYIHMSKHANELRVCDVCAKAFKSLRNLNDHRRRVHYDVKKHECKFCKMKFAAVYMLKVHLRSHTGVRPYKCTECDKSFMRADGLKEHRLTHTQREYHECTNCGKRFVSKRGVTRHTCTTSL